MNYKIGKPVTVYVAVRNIGGGGNVGIGNGGLVIGVIGRIINRVISRIVYGIIGGFVSRFIGRFVGGFVGNYRFIGNNRIGRGNDGRRTVAI